VTSLARKYTLNIIKIKSTYLNVRFIVIRAFILLKMLDLGKVL
jgi:hypothetical protein